MDAIRIARGVTGRDTIVKIFGSYHGHHDYVMVSIGVDYATIGDRFDLQSIPYGLGIPQAVADMTIAVPFNDAEAMERRIERLFEEGRAAGVRDHGGRDDEPRRRAPRARVSRGRPRDHAEARHHADLRRGQDRALHRRRRRGRALRRHARPRHACEGARRRAPLGSDRRHDEVFELVESGGIVQVGTYNGNPLSMAAARANLLDVMTPDAYAHLDMLNEHLLAGCQAVIEKYEFPGYSVGVGSKGCVTFSPEKITDYESFKANQDEELC